MRWSGCTLGQVGQLVDACTKSVDADRYAWAMGTAHEWDFTVPEGDAELLAELRRHGVRAGVRVHLVTSSQDDALDNTAVEPEFFGSLAAAHDLAERSGEMLRAGFPDR
jgi:hypothetical protein